MIEITKEEARLILELVDSKLEWYDQGATWYEKTGRVPLLQKLDTKLTEALDQNT